jgi:hypothetical protein
MLLFLKRESEGLEKTGFLLVQEMTSLGLKGVSQHPANLKFPPNNKLPYSWFEGS